METKKIKVSRRTQTMYHAREVFEECKNPVYF
jgi:hypothetical protein